MTAPQILPMPPYYDLAPIEVTHRAMRKALPNFDPNLPVALGRVPNVICCEPNTPESFYYHERFGEER